MLAKWMGDTARHDLSGVLLDLTTGTSSKKPYLAYIGHSVLNHRCMKHVSDVPTGSCQDRGSNPRRSTIFQSGSTILVLKDIPTMVDLICEYCLKPFTRRLADVNNCKRRGFKTVGCSRKCGLALRNRNYLATESGKKSQERGCIELAKYNASRTKDPLDRFITRTLNSVKSARRKRLLEVSISRDYLTHMWYRQEGRCAISGRLMEIPDMRHDSANNVGRKPTHLSPWRASVDRIDSSKGYVPGNVQFVCTIANIAKADFSMDQLTEFCSLVRSKNGVVTSTP